MKQKKILIICGTLIAIIGITYIVINEYLKFDTIRDEVRDMCCSATYQMTNDPNHKFYDIDASYLCNDCYKFATCVAKVKYWNPSISAEDLEIKNKECWYHEILERYMK